MLRNKWGLLFVAMLLLSTVLGSVYVSGTHAPAENAPQYVYTPQYDTSLWGLDQ